MKTTLSNNYIILTMGTCYAKEKPKTHTGSSPPSDNPHKISLNKGLNTQKQEETKPSE